MYCNTCEVELDKKDEEFVEIYDKCPFCNENDIVLKKGD